MELNISIMWLVPVVLGVVQAVKMTGMDSRWSPLLSIGLGVLAAMFIIGPVDGNMAIQGIVVGLASAGLWSGSKATFQ